MRDPFDLIDSTENSIGDEEWDAEIERLLEANKKPENSGLQVKEWNIPHFHGVSLLFDGKSATGDVIDNCLAIDPCTDPFLSHPTFNKIADNIQVMDAIWAEPGESILVRMRWFVQAWEKTPALEKYRENPKWYWIGNENVSDLYPEGNQIGLNFFRGFGTILPITEESNIGLQEWFDGTSPDIPDISVLLGLGLPMDVALKHPLVSTLFFQQNPTIAAEEDMSKLIRTEDFEF